MNNSEKILQDLQQTSLRLAEAVRDLDDAQLDQAPQMGGWSVRQMVHHLADGACIWSMFIRQALAGQGGEFHLRWYLDLPQKEWAEIWKYDSREVALSLDLYRASTAFICALLESVDPDSELELEICWKEGQSESMSVWEVVELQNEHLNRHLNELNALIR